MRVEYSIKFFWVIATLFFLPFTLVNGRESEDDNTSTLPLSIVSEPGSVYVGGFFLLDIGGDWRRVDSVVFEDKAIPFSYDDHEFLPYWIVPVARSVNPGFHTYFVYTRDSVYRDSVYVMPGLFSEWPAARVKKTKTAERLAAAARDDSITRTMYNFVSNPMRLWEGAFIHPTSNLRIKDTYGTLRETFTNAPDRYHYGIDYAPKVVGTIGDSIFSENDGVVVRVGYDQYTYGKYCIVDHGGGLVLSYYHTDTVLVTPGDCVKRGQLIALMGATGEGITGPHLHVGARLHGVAINPFAVMSMSERYFHNENFIEPVSVR